MEEIRSTSNLSYSAVVSEARYQLVLESALQAWELLPCPPVNILGALHVLPYLILTTILGTMIIYCLPYSRKISTMSSGKLSKVIQGARS